jgi:hypothetical protein
MERRPYFVFGDIAACAVTGAAAGWLSHVAVPHGWFPLFAMVAGMVPGILVGVVGGALFSPLFGALEVALPTGLAGMAAGGLVAMLPDLVGGPATALWAGALVGLICLSLVYLLQSRLHGEAG